MVILRIQGLDLNLNVIQRLEKVPNSFMHDLMVKFHQISI